MKRHTRCLLHPGRDSHCLQRWVLGGHIHPPAVQHSSTPRLTHTPRHRCAPFGLLFGTTLEMSPRIPAHPILLHTSPVVPTLSPSAIKLQLPQPVIISAAHITSQTRGRVPPESGRLNKRGLLLFPSLGIATCSPRTAYANPPPPRRWARAWWRGEAGRGRRRKSIDLQLSPPAQGSPSYINICQAMHLCLSMAVNSSPQCCYLRSCHSQEPHPNKPSPLLDQRPNYLSFFNPCAACAEPVPSYGACWGAGERSQSIAGGNEVPRQCRHTES